jgi:membrane dipeptidase
VTGTRDFAQQDGYKGYRSFSYLRPEVDYQDYEWTPEIDRLPLYDLGLTAEQQSHAEQLLQDSVVISIHDHPQVFPKDMSLAVEYGKAGRYPVGFEALSYSGIDVMFDSLGGPTAAVMSHYSWTWADIIYDVGHRLADIEHQDYVKLVRTVDELKAMHGSGHMGWVLTFEAATMIENDIDRLDILYGLGFRQLGLVYNEANLIGGGLTESSDGGLTRFGHRVVERMNQLGLSIDLSHAGDRTSYDAIHASEVPVMITHAGARSVWPSERMKPDYVLKALAERGGIIGIEAAPNSTLVPGHDGHDIDTVMAHFEYCAELMGIENVTFGPDTLYADHRKIHTSFARQFGAAHAEAAVPASEPAPRTREDIGEAPVATYEYCAGMENPTENFRNAIGWLVKHGYSDEDIRKVVGGNALRVLEQTWAL